MYLSFFSSIPGHPHTGESTFSSGEITTINLPKLKMYTLRPDRPSTFYVRKTKAPKFKNLELKKKKDIYIYIYIDWLMPLLKSSLTSVDNQTTAFHTWITSVHKSSSSKIPSGTKWLVCDLLWPPFCNQEYWKRVFLAGGAWVRGLTAGRGRGGVGIKVRVL